MLPVYTCLPTFTWTRHYYMKDFSVRVESIFACGASTRLESGAGENPDFFCVGDAPQFSRAGT